MSEQSKKTDHIEKAINEVQKNAPGVKAAVAEYLLSVMNSHAGVDLKKSEVKTVAEELVGIHTAVSQNDDEKQN